MSNGVQGHGDGHPSGGAAVAAQIPNHAGNESPLFVPLPAPNDNLHLPVEVLQPVNVAAPAAATVLKAYKSRHEVKLRFGRASYKSTHVIESVGSPHPPRQTKSAGSFGKIGVIISAAFAAVRGWFGGH
jgi:hypothetical protein